MATIRLLCACLASLAAGILPANAADDPQVKVPPRPESTTVTTVQPNDLPVPRMLPACRPGKCPFPGQKVTVIATKSAISVALLEVKDEFEQATGAQLEIVRMPGVEHY